MSTGFLCIRVSSAKEVIPLSDAMIRIYKEKEKEIIFERFYRSDNNGFVPYLSLDAPKIELSLTPNNRIRAYEQYNVEIRHDGYESLEVIGVQVFPNQRSTLEVNLLPSKEKRKKITYIGDHQLFHNKKDSVGEYCPNTMNCLKAIVIPEKIIVHLGKEESNTPNMDVDFIYYLKNIASSEMYTTWEEEAIRANIYAQISFVLNRIYTKWYPNQGYAFDIISEEQNFVENKNIEDRISSIIDEIFNEFIKKDNYKEPYYARYCDGEVNKHVGLKQWGAQKLALNGYKYVDILKYYYGRDIHIITTNNMKGIPYSYSGIPLKKGDIGIDVKEILTQLKIITNYYHIGVVNIVEIYNKDNCEVVKSFQNLFNINEDGIIGKKTWYKISYLYKKIKKYEELKNQVSEIDEEDMGFSIGYEDRENHIKSLQLKLEVISIFNNKIRGVHIDGIFNEETKQSVISFQKHFNTISDGVVNKTTYFKINNIYNLYKDYLMGSVDIPKYPNEIYHLNKRGENVALIQEALNTIGSIYSSIPILIKDGEFNEITQLAMQQFQKIVHLNNDGRVNKETWKALFKVANEISLGAPPSLGVPCFPNKVLEVGTNGEAVLLMQRRIEIIANTYKSMKTLIVDGKYELSTKESVESFQTLLGLEVDGKIKKDTWYLVNEIFTQLTS